MENSFARMELSNLEQIFGALQSAEVRYIVVGGLAVIAHGYLRATKDIDLVIALEPENVRRAMGALSALGFRPKVPVKAAEFGDAETRRRWIEEKGMMVFQLVSDRFPFEPIDVFVREPFDFAREYQRCMWKQLNRELKVPFISVEQLIELKLGAGRPQDIADVAELEQENRRGKPGEAGR